ncbi:hypothetical protein F4804DRAFT_326174 [Jackrogersella minutella]|nr:hypothetical protein F4804DRAFT_326174 [Jackrogersella minutella]
MAGKKVASNSKKVAGQARKAEAAAQKAAVEDSKKAVAEDEEWQKGAKSNARKEAQAAKKAEQAAKKAELDALKAEEDASLPDRAGPKNSKTAVKKTNRGLGNALSELNIDDDDDDRHTAYAASGLTNSMLLMDELVGPKSGVKVDRNAGKRVKAAYAAFEARRLAEMKAEEKETKNIRKYGAKIKEIMAEFKNSPENPLAGNLNVAYNATQEDIAQVKAQDSSRIRALHATK